MSLSRWAPASGIAFVVLFVLGFGFATSGPDNSKDPPSDYVKFYSSTGNRIHVLIGAYLLVLAAVAFSVFAAVLVARVRAAGGTPTLMIASATAFAVLLGIAAASFGWPAGDIAFGNDPVPSGELLHNLPELGFPILLVPGAFAAGAFLFSVGTESRARDILPGWLTIFSFVAAVVVLGAVAFFPLLLLPLWMLAASITLLLRGPAATG